MSKRMLEKLAVPIIRDELPRRHASHVHLLPEEAEIEYLKVTRILLLSLRHRSVCQNSKKVKL